VVDLPGPPASDGEVLARTPMISGRGTDADIADHGYGSRLEQNGSRSDTGRSATQRRTRGDIRVVVDMTATA
jgi:hypothetical protein